ncbi:alpha/beta fold hydrolase [Halomonas vilamensis]|uniref:Alpha/beta fold hydrolase n=1 Tax=Vreelandella vilamensis TaxID=531309 RepID=A0ABU1H4C5_9GAMM|nr:alpha/beta fold hydrolase [Halomonas vilamensis]MDR5898686.1 alpha/beta fold hydrolase [Halomonas vilamensis]
MNIWLYAVGLLAGGSALGITLQKRFHRRLHRELAAPREPVETTLNAHSLRGETVRFPTQRGRYLEGWWLSAPSPQGHAVITHGWGTNRATLLVLAPLLLEAGWNVLLFDVRNHGNSDSDTFSSMPRFAEDIEAALAWLHKAQTPRPTALIGHSVGAAATLLAASRRDDIATVVSVSSFAHPDGMMRRWLAEKGVPFFPLGWYVLRYVERVIGHHFDAIAPVNTVGKIHCPVLLVHGENDTVIPPHDAQALAESADNATLRLVEGGHDLSERLIDHGDELIAFLRDAL